MSGGTSVAQVRNSEQIDILSTDFIRRNEATVAWGKAISMFLMLPGLRGFWPMSPSNDGGNTYDLSGQLRTLTYNGNPTYNLMGLAPYIAFDGTGDFLNRVDEAGLDILGNETHMATAIRGLTVGGWFYPTATTNLAGYIAKYTNVAATSAFALHQSTSVANSVRFVVYSGGSNYPALSAANAGSLNTWHFFAGRYVPSTTVSVFTDGTFVDYAVAIPATLTNSTADLEIGRLAGALAYYTGYASLCFLCAAALPDRIVRALYHHTRSLFGIV